MFFCCFSQYFSRVALELIPAFDPQNRIAFVCLKFATPFETISHRSNTLFERKSHHFKIERTFCQIGIYCQNTDGEEKNWPENSLANWDKQNAKSCSIRVVHKTNVGIKCCRNGIVQTKKNNFDDTVIGYCEKKDQISGLKLFSVYNLESIISQKLWQNSLLLKKSWLSELTDPNRKCKIQCLLFTFIGISMLVIGVAQLDQVLQMTMF